jgi:DNA polymerase-3 subunit beta
MKLTTTLNRSFLRAALVTAAVQDIRYYLNGVLLELHPTTAFVVTTDGHRMTVLRLDDNPTEGLAEGRVELIVPAELVKLVKPNKTLPYVTLTYDTETRDLTIVDIGQQFTGKAVEGKFPDWRRVIPHKPSGKPADFNSEYLADLVKLHKELRPKDTHRVVNVHHNGESGALLTIPGCAAYLGVLMPVKGPKETGGKWPMPDPAAFKEAPAGQPARPAKAKSTEAVPA